MTGSLLEAAKAGDEAAFAALTAPHRRELQVHCYRILGSATDAEDLLQEMMVAAWRGLGGSTGRASLRTWLYKIATNRCLNAIRDGKRRPPLVPVPPFDPPEPTRRWEATWLQPCPDAWLEPAEPSARHESAESVRLAFVAALQRLPPRQSAALVLCDVLDFSPAEVADMLGATPTAVKGLLQRARDGLQRRPAGGVPSGGRAEGGGGGAGTADAVLARRFAEAYCADDVGAVVALLTDDAWLAMPPAPHVYEGTGAVARFLRASAAGRGGRRLRLLATGANGQPAFACYVDDMDGRRATPSGIVALSVAGERIAGITRFLDARLPALFGFPLSLGIGDRNSTG